MPRPIYLFILIVFLGSCQPDADHPGFTNIQHVVVIGIDGLSPDGIKNAHTPTIDALIESGASTMLARGVMPTSSGPNWASVLMGAGPEQHGITSNSFNPDEPSLPPVASGSGQHRLFPTVFELLHTARPDQNLCAIYHWETIASYYEAEHVSYISEPGSDAGVAREAASHLPEHRPLYCFLHFDDVDQAGHSFGHGSDAYYRAVETADSLVAEVVAALDESGLRNNTLILLTSDHGGKGFGHNEAIPEVLGIPFIMNGPHVRQGYEILETVNTVDNSPTVAFALGIQPPEAWTGWPVKSAFEGYEPPPYLLAPAVFYRKPVIQPEGPDFGYSGGLFVGEPGYLEIENLNESGVIRFTMDGTEPTAASPTYEIGIQINENAIVKAAVFEEGQRRTNVNTAYFRILPEPEDHGTRATFYYGTALDSLPDFSLLQPTGSPVHTYEFTSAGLDVPAGADQLAVIFDSYIRIEQAGEYTFTTASDDGSKLYINDRELVDNDGNHGVRERHGSIYLEPGFHPIRVSWYNSGGGLWLEAYVEGPGLPRQIIPPNMLYITIP